MKAFLRWITKYRDFRTQLDRLALSDPWEALISLEGKIDSLAVDGIDYREVARCLCLVARSNILFLERKYQESLKMLIQASPTIPIPLEFQIFLRNDTLLQKTNLDFITNNIEDAVLDYHEIIDKPSSLTPIQVAHAHFNLGNCYMIKKDYPSARQNFAAAGALYGSNHQPDKVADVYHQLGNMERLTGSIDIAINQLHKSAEGYLKTENQAGMWRVWDDIARAYIVKCRQPGMEEGERDAWAKQALDAALTAAYFSEELWKRAKGSEGRMADLSDQFASHTITLCETALGQGRLDIFFGALAINKGRIRSSIVEDLPDFVKANAEFAEAVNNRIYGATVEAVAGSSLELSKKFRKIAVIEHLVFGGNQLFIGVYFYGEQVTLEWYETALPVDLQPEIGGSRGTTRCHEALLVGNKFLKTIEAHAERCSYLLGSFNTTQSDADKAQLRTWAAELDADSSMLGNWFFPEKLLNDLRTKNIGHVALIPDPSFATIPYACLETKHGMVIDQPWTLSISTSAMEFVRIAERSNRIEKPQPLYYVAPDAEVNSGMGGSEERVILEEYFLTESVIETQASIKAACEALSNGRWVHFRGHGRWTNDVDTSGLVFSNTEILSRASLGNQKGSPGFLVTAACRTGFNSSVGTELFGLLTEYDSAGALGALFTAWPIHGPATTYFMERFYQAVRENQDLAFALQKAMRLMREANPHPYLWAPFFLIGGWMANQMLMPKN